MVKQSPSRNHRSKAVKVKNVLQICVLLAVCFWLIYQFKHSQDKKKAFDESDVNISHKTHDQDEISKLGRRGLHPKLGVTTLVTDKYGEDEAEEETGGGENKHEEEREEEDKTEEKDYEGRGGGDDEIDERNQEKSEMELGHEQDFIDEEKEREEDDEMEADDGDGKNENESSLEDHDHDGGSSNSREAREKNYQADDASSAVTHSSEAISIEIEKGNLGNSTDNPEMIGLGEEKKANNTEEITIGQNAAGLKPGRTEIAENGISLNVTVKEDNGHEVVSSKSEDSSVLNSTSTTGSKNQLDIANNSTKGSSETNDLSLQNGTETKPDATEAQNATVGGSASEFSNLQAIAWGKDNTSSIDSNDNQSDSNFNVSNNTENAEAATRESSNISTTSKLSMSEKVKASTGETTDATQDDRETDNGMDESLDSSETGDKEDPGHHDPIESDFPLEKDVRTDLDTLPDIRTEGSNDEDAAAE